MKSYRQCFNCGWEYQLYYLTVNESQPDSEEMIKIGEHSYCLQCATMDTEDIQINESRKDLGRINYVLGESYTPDQLEQEIFKARKEVLEMSQEELEQHISELDEIYKALQQEAKKVKVKTIAGLEVKRERFGTTKLKKKADKEDDQMNTIEELMKKLKSGVKSSTLKVE